MTWEVSSSSNCFFFSPPLFTLFFSSSFLYLLHLFLSPPVTPGFSSPPAPAHAQGVHQLPVWQLHLDKDFRVSAPSRPRPLCRLAAPRRQRLPHPAALLRHEGVCFHVTANWFLELGLCVNDSTWRPRLRRRPRHCDNHLCWVHARACVCVSSFSSHSRSTAVAGCQHLQYFYAFPKSSCVHTHTHTIPPKLQLPLICSLSCVSGFLGKILQKLDAVPSNLCS